ncbi:MAG TPA: FAD-dependent oxidoreductase [Candidatus Thermoplasmatota archaeon]|nr:FAD-dependent oxidoreductase [Candidatus Thermoplasmatota archaeon]
MPRAARPRVVVAGAGFAGLRVAQALQKDARVTVVAPDDFVFLPLLHEVLVESVVPPDITVRLEDAVPRAEVVRDRATSVEGRELVTASGRRLPFDALVVAVGAEPNDFGVPGVRENALPFASVRDALRASGRLRTAAADAPGRAVRVVVAGAGFTGVEVAGEAAALLDRLGVAREVTLLDALPDVFPRQGAAFRREIRAALERLRLRLRTSTRIVEALPDGVRVQPPAKGGSAPAAETVPADVVFWCAGVRPRTVAGVHPLVRPTLQSVARDDVYVCGDGASFPKEMQVPLLAQTAEQQAPLVAWNVLHPEAPKEYVPKVKGLIVSVGPRYAVAEMAGGNVVAGEVPWHVKRQLYKAKIRMA